MNADRIKEIQLNTVCPDSTSVMNALMQVWNETTQDLTLTKDASVKLDVDMIDKLIGVWRKKKSDSGSEQDSLIASCYVDAFQTMRVNHNLHLLPAESESNNLLGYLYPDGGFYSIDDYSEGLDALIKMGYSDDCFHIYEKTTVDDIHGFEDPKAILKDINPTYHDGGFHK